MISLHEMSTITHSIKISQIAAITPIHGKLITEVVFGDINGPGGLYP